jgi:hypothetical protein
MMLASIWTEMVLASIKVRVRIWRWKLSSPSLIPY